MRQLVAWSGAAWAACLVAVSVSSAADLYRLPSGKVELQSAGPLAFGPDGLLLIGDTKQAAVFAIQTGDKSGNPAAARYSVENVAGVIGERLGAKAADVTINDLVVNPLSGNLYFSVAVANSGPAIVRLDSSGAVTRIGLDNIPFSKAQLPNAPEDKVVGEGPRARNNRADSITDLAWVDGQVIVSGLSSASAPSNVRALAFPFSESNAGASLEIYHAAHGRSEDYAAIRTFIPFNIDGKPSLLAGFVCTPLVRFPLSAVEPGEKVRGTTVAELGNRNRPLDMIVYKRDGQTFLLLANSARGVMKISTADIERQEGLTKPVTGGGTAGQPYETIEALAGTVQLDKLNDEHAVVLLQSGNGPANLKTVPLP